MVDEGFISYEDVEFFGLNDEERDVIFDILFCWVWVWYRYSKC